jgi:hypothetical protein
MVDLDGQVDVNNLLESQHAGNHRTIKAESKELSMKVPLKGNRLQAGVGIVADKSHRPLRGRGTT